MHNRRRMLFGLVIVSLLLVEVFLSVSIVRADLLAVVSVTPANNSTNVPLETYPVVVFNKPVDTSTFAGSVNGMPIVPFQAAFNGTNQSVKIDLGSMEYGKTYTVVISGNLTDASGNQMGSDYTFSFATAAGVSKRPTSTINAPAYAQRGETFDITGKATGYTWQRDANNPLNLIYYDEYGVNKGNKPMLHPTVLYFPEGYDGYKFYLIYTPYPSGAEENPCLMRSNDGVNFTAVGVTNPLFKYNTQPIYDSNNLADPEVIEVGNTWMLFYEMEQTNYGHIGVAFSTDGVNYAPYGGTYSPPKPTFPFPTGGNPIIHFSDNTTYEVDTSSTDDMPRLGEMAVVFQNNTYHMWYTSANTGRNTLAVYANASDPRGPWTKLGPVLNNEGHPDVVYDPERDLYVMCYLSQTTSPAYQINFATSPKPWGPWTDHPNNPIFTAQGGWEGTMLYRSSLVEVGTQWYLYYSANTQNDFTAGPQIGLAREVQGIRKAEISTNGGSSWTQLAVSADGSWSYRWTPSSTGTYSVQVRVTDDWMVGDPAKTTVNVESARAPWSKYAGNPVLSISTPETQVAFASVFLVGSTYHMYYSYKTSGSDWMIGHATSTDRITWTKDTAHNPVLTYTGEDYCPIAWIEGSSWRMLFTGASSGKEVFYASSTDGLHWTMQNNGQPVLTSAPGQWDYNRGYNDVEGWGLMKIGSTYYLWYDTLAGLPRKTGLATSTDLVHWTKDAHNPIFSDASIEYYCSSPYYFNGYYYLLIANPGRGIRLYRDPNPTFYSADRTDLGTVISFGSEGSWDSALLDTPFILTDNITRVVNPATTIYTYYAGSPPSNVPGQTGVTVMPSMEQSLPPDYFISASPSSLTIPAGSSGSSLIGVAPTNGFTGTVSLATSAPSGWSVTVTPSSITGGSGSSTLSINVSSTATAGAYTVTVTGASGSLIHSRTVTVNVPTGPDYSISASPSALTVVAGSSNSSTVTVTSFNGFSGTVSLSASAPSGWSVTVSPSLLSIGSGGSGSSTLSVTVPSAISAGAYTVTVTGTNGSLIHSMSVTVNVQTVPSPPLSFVATAGSSQVVLSWSAPSSDGGSAITSYKIYRSSSSGSETLLTAISNLLTYADGAVTNGQIYYYEVSAVNSIGESGLSNEASATPFAATVGYFGNTNIGTSEDGAPNMYVAGGKYSPTLSGTVTRISFYVRLDASGHVKVAIYSDANGVPNALLSQSSPVAVGTSFSWVNFTISQAVVGGTNYWLCFISDISNCHFTYSAGSTKQEAYSPGISYPTFPSTFPSPSYDNAAPSIYATVSYVPANPDYSVSASPSALTVVAGSSGSSTVTVTSLNGFSGTVSLTVSAPSGWTATVTPSSVTGGSGSSTLSITVPSIATAGTYNVIVTGTSGSLSHSVTVTVNVQTVPSPPLSLVATGGNAQVTLTWSAPSSSGGSAITHYNIYRGTASGGETLLTTLGNVLAYTDTTITNGQTYYYQVSAVNSVGESSRSNEVSATPFASPDYSVSASPSSLTIFAGSSGYSTVTVTSLNGFSGTVSLLASAPSGWTATVTPSSVTGGSGSSTLSIAVPSAATAGAYAVSVTGTSGSLSHSTSVTVNVQTVPSSPQSLVATAGNATVMLSWSAPSSNGGSAITNYTIYRGGSSGGETLLTTIGNVLTYTDTSVTNGQTYYYQVSAVNSVGESSRSSEVSATPSAATVGYFGNTNIGSSDDSAPNMYIVGGKYSPTSSGTVTWISFYVRLDASGHVKVAIYSDSNGAPNALLSQSSAVAVGTSFSWVNFTISQAVVGGTNYWLCWISDISNCRFKESAGSTRQEAYSPGISYPTFPSTFPSPSYSSVAPSIYATVSYIPVNPDYSISASPSALPIPAGSSGSSLISVASLNGFSSTVSLTVSAPSGWTATVNPSSVAGGSGSSTLSITVPSTATAGTYNVTVTGTSSSLIHSVTVAVNVQTVPSSPQSLVATGGNAQVTLSWSAPLSSGGSAITNYRIYRGGSSGGETLLATISNLLTYTDTSVTNGQTYYYEVSAVNSVGESSRSNEVSATPFASPDYSVSASPSSLTVVAGSSGSSTVTVTSLNGFSGTVSLSASAPSGWSVTVDPSSVAGGSGSSTLSITVPSTASYGTYTVTVTGTSGSLIHSATVTVNVQTVPSSPQSLVATGGNAQVTLSWSAPLSSGGSAITNYRIYRGGSSGGETLLATISNLLTYTDTSVTNGQTYYYKVSAVNSIGESGLSNEASATPSAVTVGYFGKTSIGSKSDSTGGGEYVVFCMYTMPENGAITTITAYIQSFDGTPHNGKAAIYADNAGVPGAKLAESSEVSISSLGWYNFTVSYTNTQGSRTFWLAITVQNGYRYRYDAGSSNQEAYRPYAYPNFPDPSSPQGYHAFAMSIYATYTKVI